MAKLTGNGLGSNGLSSKNSSTKNRETSNSNSGSLSYKAIFFMTLLAIQFGIQPIVTQQYTSKTIIKSTVVFMQEVVKLAIGIIGISLGNVSWVDVTSGKCKRFIVGAVCTDRLLSLYIHHGFHKHMHLFFVL